MKWTPEKIEALRRRYPHEDNGRLARELGCTRKALVFRASTLGLRKTDAANEARYAALSRRIAPESIAGERREIATGTLIVRGNLTTHLSNVSASREQARPAAGEEQPGFERQDWEGWEAEAGEADMPSARRLAPITCPHCHTRFTPPAPAASQTAFSMEA